MNAPRGRANLTNHPLFREYLVEIEVRIKWGERLAEQEAATNMSKLAGRETSLTRKLRIPRVRGSDPT